MEKEEYRKHFELEESFWWFMGRREIILNVLKRIKRKKLKILDVGCGTGFNLQIFQNYGTSFGCDISKEALDYCLKRSLEKVVQADGQKLPFRTGSFDLVILLDVLYHKRVKSDIKVLQEVSRVLKNKGYLLVTDSAFAFLWSRHDIAFHARERYNKKTLRKRLEKAELSIEKISYFNFFLFSPVVLMRFLERLGLRKKSKAESDLKKINTGVNKVLFSFLKLEAFLIQHLNFPFGSSLISLARKYDIP